MSKERLENNLTKFYEEMDERLEKLSPAEQQQYLEGLVHAFDAMTRYAKMPEFSPFERENFIGSAKSWAYSKTYHLKPDPESRMRSLIESDSQDVAKAYLFAAKLSRALGFHLDEEDELLLLNALGICSLKSL